MCYACRQCGSCGKYQQDNPLYVPPALIRCFTCGEEKVNCETGICESCGAQAFFPSGTNGCREAATRENGTEI